MFQSGQWLNLARFNDSLITYQLTINLSQTQTVSVGRLGRFCFPAGRYLYAGSARKNLIARVRRHLSDEKKLRWHIDYLLSNPAAEVIDVKLFKTAECDTNKTMAGEIIVPGFGASDCRAQCGSHLKYLGQE